jgi:alkylation response protein AidB-like acyl-CoA dehydrogenase
MATAHADIMMIGRAEMLEGLVFAPPQPVRNSDSLRAEVRQFLGEQLGNYPARVQARSWNGFDADFSRAVGARGWIGMTWPKQYGGHQRSALERYIVIEEMLAAGAPVAGHWVADRQSGPLLLKQGTEDQKLHILPLVAAGTCFFCIGMSEADSGSDLAAVRTRAVADGDGFRITGSKLWTTYAHLANYMILFCRTDDSQSERHRGMSQFLIDLKTPGIKINPVIDMLGAHHFNEVNFDDVYVPDDALIGQRGDGWNQVMAELAFERSGPERFLSSFALLTELLRVVDLAKSDRATAMVGRIVAHLAVLRRLSQSVAGMLELGEDPALQAAIVKDLGALVEQEIPEMARQLVQIEPSLGASEEFAATVALTLLSAPSFSLRGGTREILRGIIARSLGLR